jgi:ribonucleoside-diphosphate reductase alpha chain
MGLGDMMFHLGIRYGSRKGQEFASQIIEYLRYHAMLTSVELAKERGPFPAIKGSRYDPENLTWTSPQPLVPHLHDWGRPELNWDQVVSGIREHGIRNAAQTTIAPTGTIATVAGCEAYGCEPSFALAYVRHVNDGGKDLQLTYTSPLFLAALERAGLDEATRERIVEQVVLSGSCQGIAEVPKDIRETFVVAGDLSVEEHVRMQAALQAFVDNCISKTINAPASATVEDVEKAYMLAWELGCKGLTIYVTGSREKVVLETRKTAASDNGHQDQVALWPESKKPRPQLLPGKTYRIGTPSGTTFITVNENGHSQPFEVFIHTSKAGSETNAVAEATGRLISYLLRLRSPVSPRARLVEVVRQLIGIGGGRSLGFGPNRVLSLPDGIAQSLDQYLGEASSREPALGSNRPSDKQQAAPGQITMRIGDLCPDCGQAAVVNEEGCRKCYYCGYSEC